MHPSVETVRKCLGDSLLKSPTTILWARHSHATPYTVKTGAKKNSSFNLMLCLVSAWQWTWWLPKRLPSLLSIESRGDLMTSRGWLQQPLGKKKQWRFQISRENFGTKNHLQLFASCHFFSNFTPKTLWTYCWWWWGTCARVDGLPILVMNSSHLY